MSAARLPEKPEAPAVSRSGLLAERSSNERQLISRATESRQHVSEARRQVGIIKNDNRTRLYNNNDVLTGARIIKKNSEINSQ